MVHLEFMGLPGSGKTTLFKHTVRMLKKKLKYSPESHRRSEQLVLSHFSENNRLLYRSVSFIPRRLRKKILDRLVFDECLSAFASENPELLATMSELFIPEGPQRTRRLFHLLSQIQLIRKSNSENMICAFDEGFFHTLFSLLSSSPNELSDEQLALIAKNIQPVDFVIVVNADIKQCIHRMKKRPEGIPAAILHITDDELIRKLNNERKLRNQILDQLKLTDTSVIEVDNSSVPLDNAISQISGALNSILKVPRTRVALKSSAKQSESECVALE